MVVHSPDAHITKFAMLVKEPVCIILVYITNITVFSGLLVLDWVLLAFKYFLWNARLTKKYNKRSTNSTNYQNHTYHYSHIRNLHPNHSVNHKCIKTQNKDHHTNYHETVVILWSNNNSWYSVCIVKITTEISNLFKRKCGLNCTILELDHLFFNKIFHVF